MSRGEYVTSLCSHPAPNVRVHDEWGALATCRTLAYGAVEGDVPFAARQHQDCLDELCAPTNALTRRARVVAAFLDLELVALSPAPLAVHARFGKGGAPPPYRPTLVADLHLSARRTCATYPAHASVQARRRAAFAQLNVAAKNMLGARLVLAGGLTPAWGWAQTFDDLMAHREAGRPAT